MKETHKDLVPAESVIAKIEIGVNLAGLTSVAIYDKDENYICKRKERPEECKTMSTWDFKESEIVVSADITVDTNLCYP